MTVLVAEDDPLARAISRILEEAGHNVFIAGDGHEAVQLFHAHADAIDVAMLDVDLPVRSGTEVATSLRAHKPGIQCVMMTGFPRDIADEALRKPFTSKQMLRALSEAPQRK